MKTIGGAKVVETRSSKLLILFLYVIVPAALILFLVWLAMRHGMAGLVIGGCC